jgi:hypothetical protein
MSRTVRLIAWADPPQEALLQDAARRGKFDLLAVESPETGSLRDLVRHDADLLWIASPGHLGTDERRLIREAMPFAITTEPIPGSAAEVVADPREAETARFVPLFRQSPGYRAAREVFDAFGARHGAGIVMSSKAGEGTLSARLFDAMDLVEALCGAAKRLEAALWRAVPGVPENLGALGGHLTVNVRFADNRCAATALSDAGGRWQRHATVWGEGGCLRIDDNGFEWITPAGETVDSHRESKPLSPGGLAALAARRILAGTDAADPQPDTARLLALCEAARISARTGEGESPQRVLEMLRRP